MSRDPKYIHMQTWSTTAPNKQKVNFHTQFGICFMLSFLCVVPFVSFLSNSWKWSLVISIMYFIDLTFRPDIILDVSYVVIKFTLLLLWAWEVNIN